MARLYRRGLKHGPAVGWYGNGRPHAMGRYHNGVREGLWKFWDKRGRLRKLIRYRWGKKLGVKKPLARSAR